MRGVALTGERTREFEDYFRLWRRFVTAAQIEGLVDAVAPRGSEAVEWPRNHLDPNDDLQPVGK